MRIAGISEYLTHVQIETQKADLILRSEPPELDITRERGGLEIQSDPIELRLDNEDFHDSIGLKSIETLAEELVARGKRAVLSGMQRCEEEGRLFLQPNNKNVASQIALMRTQKSIETMLTFIPDAPKMSWAGGTVEISYVPDKLDVDWTVHRPEGTYIPYQVSYSTATMEEDHGI